MKDERIFLGHIRDAIRDLDEYAAVGREVFMVERMRQDAVIRKLEIVGRSSQTGFRGNPPAAS